MAVDTKAKRFSMLNFSGENTVTLLPDPDGTIAGYSWLFGDGGTGYGETTSYTYPKAGIYKVRLDITDDGGDTDSDTTYAYISQGELPPVADAGGPYYGWANV